MSCTSPLQGFRTPDGVVFSELGRYDILGPIELPCGQCVHCRMRRASDWEMRVMHEASQWESNCFVTLTYARDRLPAHGSLDHRDFQLFMKRLRKHVGGRKVRFYMAGEYGPSTGRAHYHACLFNVDFRDDRVPAGTSASGHVFYESPTLDRLWTFGRVTVQDLVRETAGYCARYIMKKVLGPESEKAYQVVDEDGVVVQRKPEYAAMSLKPGIGAAWFEKYGKETYPHDYVVIDGAKRPPPKYYDKLMKKRFGQIADSVEFERQKRAVLVRDDNTPERRRVRDIVAKARVSTLKRENV